MKRNVLLLSFIFLTLFCGIKRIDAKSTAIIKENIYNSLVLRSEATVSSTKVTEMPSGTEIEIISIIGIVNNSGCNDEWYKVNYDNKEGYACGTWLIDINMETSQEDPADLEEPIEDPGPVNVEDEYLSELAKFPVDYQRKIEELHEIYPNAIFKYQKVNIAFNTFSTYQYTGYASGTIAGYNCAIYPGVSLIWDSNNTRDGLKAFETWAYTPLTDTFKQNFTGGGLNWYVPNLDTVKYYIDPRNFLTSNYVFMFENLTYMSEYHTLASVENALKNSFMENTKINGKENMTFAQAFLEIGKKYNVNPIYLVARVLQEVGWTRSNIVSGTWSSYEGYYNFFNIKAAGNTAIETINKGLAYAKSMGWNNEYTAIEGGVQFLALNYISQGQDTVYSQKFDISAPCYAYHQYMQNIEAPKSETLKLYNSVYSKEDISQRNLIFTIPVYEQMPILTELPDSKNSNNYLQDLTIDGITIPDFVYTKNEYVINVSPLISSVNIAVTKSSSKSSISGTGVFKLNSLEQTKEIVVTAENGNKKTYKVTVTRNANIPVAISTILNTLRINSDGVYISGLSMTPEYNAKKFIDDIKIIDVNADITIKNSRNESKEDKFATGDQVIIANGEDTRTFTAIIYGDTDGDGDISSLDYVKIKNHIMKTSILSDVYQLAADVDKDGSISSLDYVKIKNYIMGIGMITQ